MSQTFGSPPPPSSDISGQPPQLPNSGRSRKFVMIAVVAGLVIVNSIGFLAYRSIKGKDAAEEKATAALDEGAGSSAKTGSTDDEMSSEGLVRAYRAIGLKAFEDGDYDLAVTNLSKAVEMGGTGDIPKLLEIAKDIQSRGGKAGDGNESKPTEIARGPDAPSESASEVAKSAPGQPAAESTAERPKESAASSSSKRKKRSKKSRRPSRKRVAAITKSDEPEEKAEEPEAEPEPPKPGIVLVTSTPAKMVVAIDGKRVDLTPAKLTMEPGSYKVTMSRNGQVLYAKSVNLEPGQVVSVNRDLTEAVAEQDARVAAELNRKKQPEPAPKPPTPIARREPAKPKPPQATKYGELHIISPNVYGEVFVNKKSRGFPPLVVKNIPVGSANVEIKVQGKTRRSKRVRVAEDKRVQVRFR